MNTPETTVPSGDASRGESRRQQVLAAAAACFREHGFHGTSIQRISQAAGMSPGHIYHYFANKDEIVGGIVQGYLVESLDMARRIEEASRSVGLLEALASHVAAGIALRTQDRRVSLDLEIFAEASRNPAVRQAVQQADTTLRAHWLALMRQVPGLSRLEPGELDARIAVINIIFDGLAVRALCQPGLDQQATTRVVERVIRDLLEN